MSNQKVSVDALADAVMEGLEEYNKLATDKVKAAVKKAGTTVQKEISSTAPRKSGKYASSWRSRTTAESSTSMQVTVYSPSRYMLAHLLEHGHALRNGGRARAFPHIAPAEEAGEKQLTTDIERALS
ncbi:MAG TPA: hypothetical protein DEV97_10545 [Lachnospiraceae bacterium]|nr:hypothetical protein [Lachnospiraceae bacterium]